MYDVMIVDDENRVRQGLKNCLDWNALGFEIQYDCQTAQEALEILEKKNVDVLLTDMVMPEMDGLELIKKLHELNSNVNVVILSGYHEFQYAQQAMRFGVTNYLTKPVSFEELSSTFQNIKTNLDLRYVETASKNEYLKMKKEQLLNNLVRGLSKQNVIEDDVRLFFEDQRFDSFCVARLFLRKQKSMTTPADLSESVSKSPESLFHGFMERIGSHLVFNNDLNEFAAIFNPIGNEKLTLEFNTMQKQLEGRFQMSAFLGVGRPYTELEKLKDSYDEAGKALEYRIAKKMGCILYYEDVIKFYKGKLVFTEEVRSNFIKLATEMEEERLLTYTMNVIDGVVSLQNINIHMIYDTCVEILLLMSKFVQNLCDGSETVLYDNEFTIKKLLETDSLDEIKNIMSSYLHASMELVRGIKSNSSGLIIENAKKYMREHLGEDVSLQVLSQVLYIHPNYLSRLFKEKTGLNFTDYRTMIRTEKAKELLMDGGLTVYAIASITGFSNEKHFREAFKKQTGVGPKEYRNSLIKGS